MKTILIKTIDEAKRIPLPPIPRSFVEHGQKLFQQAKSGKGRHSILRDIYALVDRVGDLIDPYTVCSKGCSACCNIPVSITELEATYIERNEGQIAQRNVQSSLSTDTSPCPFLARDRTCSIYASRPYACRVYAAFDNPDYCAELDMEHVTYGHSSNAIYADSKQWLLMLNGRGAVADIRVFFPKTDRRVGTE